MCIKTTMRYHLASVRMAIIKKNTNNKCWRGCGVKDTLLRVGGKVNHHSHCGKQYGGFSKVQKQNYHMIQLFHSGYISKENEDTNLNKYMHPNIQAGQSLPGGSGNTKRSKREEVERKTGKHLRMMSLFTILMLVISKLIKLYTLCDACCTVYK